MKKLIFSVVAALGCLSSFAQNQGEDNGFGLKFDFGFRGDKYGAYEGVGLSANDQTVNIVDDTKKVFPIKEFEKGDKCSVSKIPMFGLTMDNRWYVANPGNFGIGISARWLDVSVGALKYEVNGEVVARDLDVKVDFLGPGLMGTYYLGDDKAIEAVKKAVTIGMPISIQLVIVSLGLTFIQRAVNEFGKSMTASFTVGNRIEQYINLPCNALQTTLATYTGQNIGAGKMDRVKKGAKQAVFISFGVTVVISAIIWIFSGQIANMFSLSPEALEYCLPHIKTVAMINIVLSTYIPLFGLYQGMGHSFFPTIVATCALGVRVIVVYLLRYSPYFGHTIIWWNGLFGFGVGCTITWAFYLSGIWKKSKKL